MATFNKRGYKAPKEKEEKGVNTFVEDIEKIDVDAKDSATAKAFDTLDETASKAEDFVAKNQKYILSFLGAVAVVTVGYLMYQKFIAEPKQQEAAEELFVAQQNFQKAVEGGAKADSLYNLVLKGSEGKFGVVKIAEEYSGTNAGNLANYYAGIAYLNTKKYAEAITSLEKFSSDDIMLSTLAKGAIGDAYAQQNKQKEALDFYLKAADANKNDFTRPRFLLKAGKTALALGNKADAVKYFTDIKDNYDASPEAQGIDALIGLAQ
ncbi:tetratricopeptide repeat protein [Flavobacterium phycosphaerae]|uniref:tetratricopeptide repeat protein n=1 Tax=Flavobacterium phycosphaerae TaxID=2697515 RepID=UPI00138A47D4|nr:tetratricopeptide repeat protein [Flavobacterium phycosphaerae]